MAILEMDVLSGEIRQLPSVHKSFFLREGGAGSPIAGKSRELSVRAKAASRVTLKVTVI